MGTPELHLSSAASTRTRLVAVAGESMRPFLCPGDVLELDLDPARRSSAGPGDIVIFLDADARLTAHRVLARWRGTFLTKGDARLLPDAPLPEAAIAAVAAAVLAGGRRRALDGGIAGLLAATAGTMLAAGGRLAQLAAWPLRGGLLAAWSCFEACVRGPLWTAAPRGARALAAALARAETGAEALRGRLGAALRRSCGGREEPSAWQDGPRWAGGMLTGDETWSGEVQLLGDVVIPAGVTLTISAGARVAARAKRWHHGASRRALGAARQADPRRPRLAVYGRLIVAGRADAPVRFTGEWEGIALYGGALDAHGALIESAVRGVSAHDGARARLEGCVLKDCDVALEALSGSRLDARDVTVEGTGALALGVADGARARWHGGRTEGVETAFRVRSAGRLVLFGAAAAARGAALDVERGAVVARRSRLQAARAASAAASTLRLDRLRVRGGAEGVSIRDGSRLTLRSCRVSADAAALSIDGSRASVSDCSLRGGRFGSLASGAATLRLERCVLRGEQAAAQAEESASLSAASCLLSHGGGGLAALGRASARLSSCRLSGNSGHGVWAHGDSSVVLEKTATARNKAGGILVSDAAQVSMSGGISRADTVAAAADGGRLSASGWKVEGTVRAGALLSAGTHAFEDCEFAGGARGLEASGRAAARLTRVVFADIAGPAVALAGEAAAACADIAARRCAAGFELAEDSGIEGSRLVFEDMTGHGLCLQDRARLSARGVNLARCGANGVYLQGQAALEVTDGSAADCGCGFAADGGSSLLRDVEFTGSRRAGALLAAGSHVLERCSFSGGPVGLEAGGRATAKLTSVSFSGASGPAVALAGQARAALAGACVEGCGAGLELAEDSGATGSGLVIDGVAGHGLRVMHRAVFHGRNVNVVRCGESGAYIDGQAVLDLQDARLLDCANGLGADGGSSQLKSVELRDSRRAAALLSAGAHVLEDCSFFGGPAGLQASGSAMAQLTRASFAGAAGPAVALAGKAAALINDAKLEACGTGLSLAEDARLDASELTVKDMAGHGVSLRDRARMSARETELSGCEENGFFLQDLSVLELSDGRISGCSAGLAADGGSSRLRRIDLFGARRRNADLAAGRHSFEDCLFDRAPEGLSLRGHAHAELTRARLAGHQLAARVAGRSTLSARSCRWTGNQIGLWTQEAGASELSACRFAAHSQPAVRLGQESRTRLSGCLFHGDWMAVFAEDDSSLDAERTLFRRTPTGVKLEGRSRASLRRCRFSGCALDGLWVASAARARAEACVFARCRVGLHAHAAARPEWPGSSFRLNAGDDRRAFGA